VTGSFFLAGRDGTIIIALRSGEIVARPAIARPLIDREMDMGKMVRRLIYFGVVGGIVLWFFITYRGQIDAVMNGEEIKPFFFQKDS